MNDSSEKKKSELLRPDWNLISIVEYEGDVSVSMDDCFFHHHGPDRIVHSSRISGCFFRMRMKAIQLSTDNQE